MRDRRIDQLDEVVRQNLRRQTDRDTVGTLRQQQREFHGKRHRLLVPSVVGKLPESRFRIEDRFQRKLGEARLYITRSRSTVTGEDITPVSLAVDQQVFLSELYQCITDRSIAVRMELHGMSDNVRHLVVASVVQPLH